jgi:hypothetical protein
MLPVLLLAVLVLLHRRLDRSQLLVGSPHRKQYMPSVLPGVPLLAPRLSSSSSSS